jgi:PPOX class probable F420-dependent enzyme
MAATITDRARELLQAPNFCHVATLRKDGSPHGALVWVDVDGDRLLLNSAEGRDWPANVARDPRIALTVANAENPYETVIVRGRVTEITKDGADEHIDQLAMKYLGQETYPFRQEGEVRLKIVVEPDRVAVQGG